MRICIAGWYFHEPLLQVLENSKHICSIVAHRHPDKQWQIPISPVANVGLEFGCYNWFLMHEWKDGDVMFCHDDIEITERSLDGIAGLNRDQCFLFSSEEEARANGYAHGRAMFCSERFLRQCLNDGGFWYDEGNHGDIGPTTADAPDYHNNGIRMFRAYLLSLPKDFSVNRYAVVRDLKCGYRGRI